MDSSWVRTDWPTLVAVGVAVVAAIVAVVLAVQGRRAVRSVRADLAARQLPEPPRAGAQTGQARAFQLGAGLSLHITPLKAGLLQFTATIHGACGGGDVSSAYPLADELAREIAGALERRRD